MVSIEKYRELALSFPGATEQPHFEKTSFRVNKKIFSTLDMKKQLVCVKLSEVDQDLFSLADKTVIYPIPNKWGKQGWTFVELQLISDKLLTEIITTAYCEVAPKKLAEHVRSEIRDLE